MWGILKQMPFCENREPALIDSESKRFKLFLMDLADVGTIVVFADDQYSLRLVAHFRTDMPAHIVISFIQV